MNTFCGKVSDLRGKFFPEDDIKKFWKPKKLNINSWLKEVNNDVFHVIDSAVVALGVKEPGKPKFSLNAEQLEKVKNLVNLWVSIRGREIFPPNSNDPDAKKARKNGIVSITKAGINDEKLILLTLLCPNHQMDNGGVFISDAVHPKALKAVEEFKEIRKLFKQNGVNNLTHVILLGDVDLSRALLERFTKEQLKKQLNLNFVAWENIFSDEDVNFHRMTNFFKEQEWEERHKDWVKSINDGHLLNEVIHVSKGRQEPMEKKSGRHVSTEEVLERTKDSVAAHLSTNSFLKETFPGAIVLDASNGIDLLWTMNSVPGEDTLCLSIVQNHQPWRD